MSLEHSPQRERRRPSSGRVLLSFDEAAARLRYHVQHLRRLLRTGKLKLTVVRTHEGGRPSLLEDEIEALKGGVQ